MAVWVSLDELAEICRAAEAEAVASPAAAGQEVVLAQLVQTRQLVPVVRVGVLCQVLVVLADEVLAVLAVVQAVDVRGLRAVQAVVVLLQRPQEQGRCSQRRGRRARSNGTSSMCDPAHALASSLDMLCVEAPRRSATSRSAGTGEGHPSSGR